MVRGKFHMPRLALASRTCWDWLEPFSYAASRPSLVRTVFIFGCVDWKKARSSQLADVARDLGLSDSTYMRQVVLSRPLPPRRAARPIPEVNRETYHALGRLAADLTPWPAA